MNEKQFATAVEDALRLFGWCFYHVYEQGVYARRSTKGFPDYICVRERVIFMEIKGDKGELTQHQQEWIDLLRCAGQEVYCWWPKDTYEMIAMLKELKDERT